MLCWVGRLRASPERSRVAELFARSRQNHLVCTVCVYVCVYIIPKHAHTAPRIYREREETVMTDEDRADKNKQG